MQMQMDYLVFLFASPPQMILMQILGCSISQMEALPVTVCQLQAATASDRLLSKVYRYTKGNWSHNVPADLRPFFTWRTELMVEEGCLLRVFRVVPQSLRAKLLKELHADHPGVTRMKSVARSYMWWPGLDKQIEDLAKSCTACHLSLIHI